MSKAGINSRMEIFSGLPRLTSLGTDMVGPYSANVNNLAAGTYRLSAVATDNQSARATNSITVIVNAQPIDPTFSDANWSALGSGLGHNLGWSVLMYALAVSGSSLYAGGFFATAGGSPAYCIAKWNGTNWSGLGSSVDFGFDLEGATTTVYALAGSGGDVYVGGCSNGRAGARLPTSPNGTEAVGARWVLG